MRVKNTCTYRRAEQAPPKLSDVVFEASPQLDKKHARTHVSAGAWKSSPVPWERAEHPNPRLNILPHMGPGEPAHHTVLLCPISAGQKLLKTALTPAGQLIMGLKSP